MNIITEDYLRQYFRKNKSEKEFTICKNNKFTPSALDYIKEQNIKIIIEDNNKELKRYSKPIKKDSWVTPEFFKILYTGETIDKKPETMTHLYENVLVYKNDNRIILRGKLDSLQAKIIEFQATLSFYDQYKQLIDDLSDILDYTRKILASEVLNQELPTDIKIIGFNEKQIREISHNPLKHFNMEQMILVNYKDGIVVSKLNLLRTMVREIEIDAVNAFRKEDNFERSDIIQALNRLSSIFHILMYREISNKTNDD